MKTARKGKLSFNFLASFELKIHKTFESTLFPINLKNALYKM